MENSTGNTNNCDKICVCVGYANVPIQYLNDVYPPSTALRQGSIFPELVLTIDEYGKVCKQGGMR